MLPRKTGQRIFISILVSLVATVTFVTTFAATFVGSVGAKSPNPQESDTAETTPSAPLIPHTLVGRENCLMCHGEGFGGAPIIPTDHETYPEAECQSCHQTTAALVYEGEEIESAEGVIPTPIVHPPSEGQNTCVDCHILLGGDHQAISEQWENSVHGEAGIGCADCHGGDPRTDEMNLAMRPDAGYLGVPRRESTPDICGGCHSDVERMRQYNLPTDIYSKYITSVHGIKIKEGDTRVAICVDCHGTHDVKSVSDPSADVYPTNVPDLCARCHSDATLMEVYNIPTNQYELFAPSVHGEALLTNQDIRAPNCASCHGSHGAKPPQDDEVVNVCGNCHMATEEYYQQSLHARLEGFSPKCWTCHGTHDIYEPGEDMLFHPEPKDDPCGACHIDETNFRMDKSRFALQEDRRCDTCHHPGSRIMVQVQALYTSLNDADRAFEEAEEAIQLAASRGMLVMDAEAKLTESHTSLLRARAALHTTKLPLVNELAADALASANNAMEIAANKLGETLFRRQAMFVVLAVIVVNIATLYTIKHRLYLGLKKEDADTE